MKPVSFGRIPFETQRRITGDEKIAIISHTGYITKNNGFIGQTFNISDEWCQ